MFDKTNFFFFEKGLIHQLNNLKRFDISFKLLNRIKNIFFKVNNFLIQYNKRRIKYVKKH